MLNNIPYKQELIVPSLYPGNCPFNKQHLDLAQVDKLFRTKALPIKTSRRIVLKSEIRSLYKRNLAMNKTIFILLFLLASNIYAQELPFIEFDSSSFRREYIAEISDELMQFDEFIAYSTIGSWSRTYTAFVVGYKAGQWKSYKYVVKYKGGHYFEQTKYRLTKQRKKLDYKAFELLLSNFEKHNFYSLDLDSLNLRERMIGDSISEAYYLIDGSSDVFTLRNGQGPFSIYAYMPEVYQTYFFIEERRLFIECKQQFRALFD